MKRRVIHPYKILAVALGGVAGASVGCTTQPRPDPTPTTTASPANVNTAPLASSLRPAEAPAPSAPGAALDHAPPPTDDKADPKLLALRDELDRTASDQLPAKQDHFRPLCDKDGYPLVGNLNRKSPPTPSRPSAFCESLRVKKPS